jgi:hypothetical protein
MAPPLHPYPAVAFVRWPIVFGVTLLLARGPKISVSDSPRQDHFSTKKFEHKSKMMMTREIAAKEQLVRARFGRAHPVRVVAAYGECNVLKGHFRLPQTAFERVF